MRSSLVVWILVLAVALAGCGSREAAISEGRDLIDGTMEAVFPETEYLVRTGSVICEFAEGKNSAFIQAEFEVSIDPEEAAAAVAAYWEGRDDTSNIVAGPDTADTMAPAAEAAGVTLLTSGSDSLHCPVDRPSVARAVTNLVDNAIRHSPAGETVDIHVEATGGVARVSVTDRGPGIDPEHQDEVFERFGKASTHGGGTGLGLAIARQVAQAHGGTLEVTSPTALGSGCRFDLDLPIGESGAAPSRRRRR